MKDLNKSQKRMVLIRKIQKIYTAIIVRLMQVACLASIILLIVLVSDVDMIAEYNEIIGYTLLSFIGFMLFMNIVDLVLDKTWNRLYRKTLVKI
jgi:hypothetical protein